MGAKSLMPDTSKTKAYIEDLMRRKGLTYSSLGSACGLSPPSMCRQFVGSKRRLTMGLLSGVAKAFPDEAPDFARVFLSEYLAQWDIPETVFRGIDPTTEAIPRKTLSQLNEVFRRDEATADLISNSLDALDLWISKVQTTP